MIAERPYAPRLRLRKPSADAEEVLGRLLYGRRPKEVWVIRVFAGTWRWPPTLRVLRRRVAATVYPHDLTHTDWTVQDGTDAELEELVRLVGGKRATLQWIPEEQWREELAAAMRGED